MTAILKNGTLRVIGNGKMEDYPFCNYIKRGQRDLAPWYVSSCLGEFGYPALCNLSITDVVIENGVTHIGDYAFCGLKWLKSVTIPASVVSIGADPFINCNNLTSITVATDNAHYASVDGVLFNKDKTTLIRYPQGKNGAYTIPSSVTTIGATAFYGSSGLTSVTIPNSVTTIESDLVSGCKLFESYPELGSIINTNFISIGVFGAFGNCTSLTSITIPGSVTSIGNCAFFGCTGLTSITIENGVDSIGRYAFLGCLNLTSITIAEENARYSSVDGVLFNKTKDTLIHYPMGRLGAYTIPSSVTSIGNKAFLDCKNLTSVSIPNSVTSIGDFAFLGCVGLTSVTIPGSVTSIGDRAFQDCIGLTSVTFEEGVTVIGSNTYPVFYRCRNLTSVTIPSSVTNVKLWAFSEINNDLISVTSLNPVPPNITRITFCSIPPSTCLYVPAGSIDAYRADEGWNHFDCIKDLESTPKGE
jgi:hypothetical protein